MTKKLYLATLGCRTNQADSAALREEFAGEGFELTLRAAEADVIVVNSCTVTQRSDQQVRQLARRLRRESPSARVIVTGCYAQRSPEAAAQILGVDAVVGNTLRSRIVEIAHKLEGPTASYAPARAEIFWSSFTKSRTLEVASARFLGGRTRPFVKIQDGCDAACSYCVIPLVRGPGRSVPPNLVEEQVRGLAAAGHAEIVLTGIHMSSYGRRLRPRCTLEELLRRLLEVPGDFRLRLSSIEPMHLSHAIVDLAAGDEKIAPHFHICLQSGSDRILRLMRRPYSVARFTAIIDKIRNRLPDAGIGTDVLVGFPGETEQDHQLTLELVERLPFTYLHVFPYSDRPGTPASSFEDHIAPAVLKRRCEELRLVSRRKQQEFRRRFLGQTLRMVTLSEEEGERRLALSGNYLQVKVDFSIPPDRLVDGRVTGEEGERLIAEVAEDRRPKL
jgi:threonylcarbamoyladenosine tRNA methylthiotransferase MtaB